MIFNLTRTRLLVRDFRACFKFYQEILGLTHVGGNENGPYAEFNTGTHLLALFDRQRMSEVLGTTKKPVHTDCQDRIVLIFEVQDVDTTYNNLKKKGLIFVTKPTDRPAWGLRTAHLRDPEGNLIELYTNRPEIYIS
jgi:lactoylglutathione lyase